MKPLYSKNKYINTKSTEYLSCTCYYCDNSFQIMKKNITQELKYKRNRIKYCSKICYDNHQKNSIKIKCTNCNHEFKKTPSNIKKSKSGNHFCSKSCAATYNNTHKKHGNRKSKLEIWLKKQLTETYLNLEIYFNRKDIINSELDIYIPSLKLAFELNGIFHYEPIFGEEKLQKIKNNDNRKFQACLEQNIELCIIDTSQQKYFKEKTSQKYFHIIITIINNILNQRTY